MKIKLNKIFFNLKSVVNEKKVPNVVSRIFFTWMLPVFYKGYSRDLKESDLVPAKQIYESRYVGDTLEKYWLEEQAHAKELGRIPSFKRTLFKAYFLSFLAGGWMQFLSQLLKTTSPLLFAELLNYWSADSKMTRETAALYAIFMILTKWVGEFLSHHGDLYCEQFGMKLRIATSSLMYRKIMRMSSKSLNETATGKLINMLSNDLYRFDTGFLYMHYIWIIPIQVAIVVYLGYIYAGVSAVIGIILLFLMGSPMQSGLGRLIGTERLKTAIKTDERLKIMSEVINGIQVIKMYVWEKPFEKLVKEKRENELRHVRKTTLLRTIMMGSMVYTLRSAMFFTICILIFTGNSISANVIYPINQFMNVLQVNITIIFPLALTFAAELIVSIKRVQDMLSLDEIITKFDKNVQNYVTQQLFRLHKRELGKNEDQIKPLSYRLKDSSKTHNFNKSTDNNQESSSNYAIELKDISASWVGDHNNLTLGNITLQLEKGKLYAIIGEVGSGKSSFLQLLLNELPVLAGSFCLDGSISYSSQDAWLFPSSVRDNILFGLSYDPERYKKVCQVCALESDFKQLQFGDQTLVGERGITLSGGQRARINLARAVYRESDIYLLDDPLSAVDAKVGRQLFDGCIKTHLNNKTRILVTHQIHFVKAADSIIFLNEGNVVYMGTFDELLTSGHDFAASLKALQDKDDTDCESDSESIEKSKTQRHNKRKTSITSNELDTTKSYEHQSQEEDAEESQSGSLKLDVIAAYFKASGSYTITIITVILLLLAAGLAASGEYWISYWANQISSNTTTGETKPGDLNEQIGLYKTWEYLMYLGIMVLLCFVVTNARIIPFVTMCMAVSKNLHNRMFSTLLGGVMRFFDSNPSGRILNRFSKDIGAIDDILPRTLLDVCQIHCMILFMLIVNAVSSVWTVIPSVILIIGFVIFTKIYMKTGHSIKRIEGVSKSPVFGKVSSSLRGIATIRSAAAEKRLIEEFDRYQDIHTSSYNCYLAGYALFGFTLDTLCIVYMTVVTFMFIYIDFGAASVGSVGLVLTQINFLTSTLQHGARMLVEFLAQLVSVERVLEYTRIDTETDIAIKDSERPSEWPTKGNIVFKNVYLRYSPEAPPVLNNINIDLKGGWKIGVVGRTGAGKSSLISAIFRFATLEGIITIDGVNTSHISREELRSKISIIPQEPVLFSATIRYNLDPFNVYSDDDIWRALEQADLKATIQSLDFKVTEGGTNFSVGQRQLMCLARAILRSNKILIMDEATANVDPRTENFIQETIRSHFASCTVLTIAHRMNTIMDSDRVFVMEAGNVIEFDHPFNLLSDPNSHLSAMVAETDSKLSNQLLDKAKESYTKCMLKEKNR